MPRCVAAGFESMHRVQNAEESFRDVAADGYLKVERPGMCRHETGFLERSARVCWDNLLQYDPSAPQTRFSPPTEGNLEIDVYGYVFPSIFSEPPPCRLWPSRLSTGSRRPRADQAASGRSPGLMASGL